MRNKNKRPKLSVVIPCFNEEEVIEESYRRLHKVMNDHRFLHELIFIDDGSTDATADLLKIISKKDSSVKVIRFSRNFGHQPAVSAGLKYARGEIVVVIDADLQDPPECIPDMVNLHLKEGFEIIHAVRKHRKGENRFKLWTAKVFYRLINRLSDVELPLDSGDFRLITRPVVDAFNKLTEKQKYIRGLFAWLGFKQGIYEYERDPRAAGTTKYHLRKMLRFALNGILYFSHRPLQLATTLGLSSVGIGLLLTVYIIIARFSMFMHTVPGWASTLVVIIFFGGVQLFAIGVIGEYISSIFSEVKGRPEFVIREIIESSSNISEDNTRTLPPRKTQDDEA